VSFMITASEEELEALADRLEKTRFPDQLELPPGEKWSYGAGATSASPDNDGRLTPI